MARVKICGNTTLEDALFAAQAGADMLGFIFYPPSPRAIGLDEARTLVAALRNALRNALRSACEPCPLLVGVFVNETAEHMRRVLDEVNLDLAQLSGNESPDILAAMNGRAFKVVRGKTWAEWRSTLVQVNPDRAAIHPAFLLDADHETLYGGSGVQADQTLAVSLAQAHPMLLAGGLTPDNVSDVVRQIQPWGVDVASGTESSPGKKDHAKVQAFIRNAKL